MTVINPSHSAPVRGMSRLTCHQDRKSFQLTSACVSTMAIKKHSHGRCRKPRTLSSVGQNTGSPTTFYRRGKQSCRSLSLGRASAWRNGWLCQRLQGLSRQTPQQRAMQPDVYLQMCPGTGSVARSLAEVTQPSTS